MLNPSIYKLLNLVDAINSRLKVLYCFPFLKTRVYNNTLAKKYITRRQKKKKIIISDSLVSILSFIVTLYKKQETPCEVDFKLYNEKNLGFT